MDQARRPSISSKLQPVSPQTVYRLFNPNVPVIVCSKFGQDVAAMPANSCSPISDSPPMISLAVRKGIRTNLVISSASRFSINWVNFEPERLRRTVLELAKPFEPASRGKDKLEQHRIPYVVVGGIPVLVDACAFALCKVRKQLSTGDHDLFVAAVTRARAIHDFTEDGYWRFEDYEPVLYLGSIHANPLTTIRTSLAR